MDVGRLAKLCPAIVTLALAASVAFAQAPVRPSYGVAVNLETAKKIAAGAMAEAKKQKWNVAVAVVDNHGMLIYYEMQDDTQTAAADVSIQKARTAAIWRRPSKEFEQSVADGRLALLGLNNALPIEGGLPIIIDGRMIGAVGVSGVTAAQDAQVARAGLDALK
jgi:glc operon protein GlcG